jgi:hypothetical protein
MMKLRLTARKKVAALAAVSAGLISAGTGLMAIHQAAADPGFANPVVGVGSDTTQDVMDALSGAAPWPGASNAATAAPKFFTPITSSQASSFKQVISWDAIPFGGSASNPGCITPKLNAPSMDRPNGSSNGITALRAAIFGTGWQASTASCTGAPVTIGGANLDFARSSRGPNDTSTTDLTFVPFARDAVMYVAESNGADDVSTLTTAQIASGYTNPAGTFTVGGTTVAVCLPQPGSGTRSFWEGAIGVVDGTAAVGPTALGCNTLEEHGGNSFDTFAQTYLGAHANSAVIFPFSVAQWVAQGNGFGVDRSNTFRGSGRAIFGDPDDIGGATGPFSGTAPNLAGNPTFYNFSSGGTVGTYGRDVYNVFQTSKVTAPGDAGIRTLFNTNGTVNANGICGAAARTIVHNFGFLDPASCGSTALKGKS